MFEIVSTWPDGSKTRGKVDTLEQLTAYIANESLCPHHGCPLAAKVTIYRVERDRVERDTPRSAAKFGGPG